MGRIWYLKILPSILHTKKKYSELNIISDHTRTLGQTLNRKWNSLWLGLYFEYKK